MIAEHHQLRASGKSSERLEDFTDALLYFAEENPYGERLAMEEVKANLMVSPSLVPNFPTYF
jgi:hypothetical protein